MEEAAAAAMVILSISSDRGSRMVRDAIIESEERMRAIVAVLPHMPPQTADPVLRWLMSSDEPALVAAGLRTLAVTGRVTEDTVRARGTTREPVVIEELVHAAGTAGLTRTAESLCVLVESVPDVQLTGIGRVALLSIAPASSLRGDLSVERLVWEMPVAAALICLRDGTSIFRYLPPDQITSVAAIEACGWCGEQTAKPLLLRFLESGEAKQKSAAASALYRIYGVACYEEVEDPTPVSADEDETPKRRIKRLSHERPVWEAALRDFNKGSPAETRLRHGIPWSRRAALSHLKRAEAAFAERLVAAWEYAVVNRVPLPCHPSLFVTRQREAFSQL